MTRLNHFSLWCQSTLFVSMNWITACGPVHQSPLTQTGSSPSPVLVYMGGNQSCPSSKSGGVTNPRHLSFAPWAEKMKADFESEKGIKSFAVYSCYESDAKVHYSLEEGGPVFHAEHDQFFEDVLAYAGSSENLILVGHSYGGWLAMKFAKTIGYHFEFNSLFTIDPISRVHCTFSRPAGCQEAPRDVPPHQRERIADASQHWTNFYQRQTFYLRSSSMREARENLRMELSHTEIPRSTALWEHILIQLTRLF